MNNGKYHTEEYKKKQSEKIDKKFGPIIDHSKKCKRCGNTYTFTGREHTKQYKASMYCSRSCANNRQEWWINNATQYRTIAFRTWKQECAICGFDKVVTVHHIDENHNNNEPKNLIPLCPNHHEMVHSKWSNEVTPLIQEIVTNKWGQ